MTTEIKMSNLSSDLMREKIELTKAVAELVKEVTELLRDFREEID